MPNLYPVIDAPDLLEQQIKPGSVKYGRSWTFDFEAGEFVLDGGKRVKSTDGHTAWAQWCIKAIQTERYAYLAYSKNYGSEIKSATKQPTKAATESEMKRTITETLLADPRTERVEQFEYEWSGDQLHVSFLAVPVIGTSVRLEVSTNG